MMYIKKRTKERSVKLEKLCLHKLLLHAYRRLHKAKQRKYTACPKCKNEGIEVILGNLAAGGFTISLLNCVYCKYPVKKADVENLIESYNKAKNL